MSTPATYKIITYHFYVSGDNDPEKAAVRFKNMLNIYNATSKHSHTESFLLAERKVYIETATNRMMTPLTVMPWKRQKKVLS